MLKAMFPNNPYQSYQPEVDAAVNALFSRNGAGADQGTGWLNQPKKYVNTLEYEQLKKVARCIRNSFDVVLSCGIGGSYLGARAIIEAVYGPDYNGSPKRTGPQIYFVGQHTSSEVLEDVIDRCINKKVCIITISKSGETLETAIALRIICAKLKPYVITITGRTGTLREMTREKHWLSFTTPDDIGGRYSVFTVTSLLTIAIAGIDVDALLEGAARATGEKGIQLAKEYAAYRFDNEYEYAEFFAVNTPWLGQLLEWHRHLMGESQGKDGVGLYPTGGIYPTDLHSVGQFIQDGTKIFFETQLIRVNTDPIKIPKFSGFNDKLKDYVGMSLDDVNVAQMNGTKAAHEETDLNVAQFTISDSIKELAYFMQVDMMACAIEAYLLKVNPFDQPGVEAHKKKTREIMDEMSPSKKYNK